MNAISVPDRIDALARRHLGGAARDSRRLTGGASQELWSFDVDGTGYVLRRRPDGDRIDRSGLATLDDEAAVIVAVGTRGVPVPRIAHVLTTDDALGSGFVASREPGEALGRRIVDSPAYDAVRPALAATLGTILAGIHTTPPASLPPLAIRTPDTVLDGLERQLRTHAAPRPVFEAALVHLRRIRPDAPERSLVHGDLRTGNYLLTPAGVSAVLDWESCHFGDPLADLGWLCMPVWRFGHLDRPVGGVGAREDLYATYAAATGTPIDRDRVRFWEIVGMLRWGLTCLAMATAVMRGDRSIERAAVGRRASEAELELVHALTRRAK